MATISHHASVGPKGKPSFQNLPSEITDSSEATANGKTSLPVVCLPEGHRIISGLPTFLFPVPPVLPPTREQTLELLSAVQKYQVSTALARIRDCAARRQPRLEFTCFETTLKDYSLAWKYGLLEEALLAA